MTYAEGQLAVFQAYLLRDHAEIVSGAYKLRKTKQGCEKTEENPSGWRDLTDEEKLESCLGTMTRRIGFMSETIEYIEKGDK